MIRASDLRGLAVVDLDAAEKLGTVDEVIIDPDARRVAGFTVSHGTGFLGGGQHMTIPASAVHALGHDAITVRHARDMSLDVGHLGGLPHLSQIVGHKTVTHSGAAVGSIDDVLIDPSSGVVVGYTLGGGVTNGLGGLLGSGEDSKGGDYVRAEADIKVGRELVVVPDDAVVRSNGETIAHRATLGAGWLSASTPRRETAELRSAEVTETRPLPPPAATRVDWADTSIRDVVAPRPVDAAPRPIERVSPVDPAPVLDAEPAVARVVRPGRVEETAPVGQDLDATQVIPPVEGGRGI